MSIELEQQLQACQAENQNLRRQLEQKTKVAARALASYQQRALHMEIIRQQNEDLDRLAASLTQAKQLAEDHVHQAEAVAQRLALANAALEKEIIERKRAEEILAKRTAELEDASSFLDSIVENIPIMIVVKDAQDLKFVRWNKYGEKLTGVDQKQFIGKSDYDFFPKEEADFFTAKDREVLAGGKLIDIPEEPIQIATGETRLLHTQKVPIFGADGKPKYLLAIAEDITERKQAEMLQSALYRIATVANADLGLEQLYPAIHAISRPASKAQHRYRRQRESGNANRSSPASRRPSGKVFCPGGASCHGWPGQARA